MRPSDLETPVGTEGPVVAALPSGLYRIDVDGRAVIAHAGHDSERHFVRVLVGDRVVVEIAHRDLT